MFGLDERHVRDAPRSDAHRLAEEGSTTAEFRCVTDESRNAPTDAVDHVEVVDAGEWCVLRYRGILRGAMVVDPDALPGLARHLLDGDGWEVDCEGDPPDWLPADAR